MSNPSTSIVRLIGRGLLSALTVFVISGSLLEGCCHGRPSPSGRPASSGERSTAVERDASSNLNTSKPDTLERGDRTLAVSLTGTAVLSITDPLGRTIRYDAENNRYVSEIPSSDADRGSAIWDPADSTAALGPADEIEIVDAINGDYRIDVMGQDVGDFGLSLLDFDTAGGVTGWTGSGATAPGSRIVYIVRYTSTPGDSIRVGEVSADSLQRR